MSFERFEELYERYCDGELIAAEREEFLTLLARREMRERFVQLSAVEVALSEELHVAAAARDRKGSSKKIPMVRLRRTPEPVSWRPALAAGAIFAFVALLALAFSQSTPTPDRFAAVRPREIHPAPKPEPAPASPAAPREPTSRPAAAPAPQPLPPAPAATSELPPTPVEPNPPPAKAPVAIPAPPIKATVAPQPKPPPAKPPAPRPPVEETIAFIASLERAQGDVMLLTAKGPVRAETGKGIQAGQGVRVGRESHAAVRFPDGTTLRLWPETQVTSLVEGATQGKTVQLEQGIAAVEAGKQPANRPMVVATSLAEATVLGTEFTMTARPAFTRLDVREGRVKFARTQGGAPVIVPAGHYAIAGAGTEFGARPSPAFWKAPGQALTLWLRADTGVKANGTSVTDWVDASPLGNHGYQRSPASQPVLVQNALAGRPALRFDGVDDFLALPPGFSNFRAGLSLFLVARVSGSPAGWVRFLELSNGGADDNISFVRKDGRILTYWAYDAARCTTKVDAPNAWAPDQLLCLSVVMGPKGAVTFYRNGFQVGSGTTYEPAGVTRKKNAIGKSSYAATDPYFQGEIGEVILYGRALPDAERQHVEAYLHSKYLDSTAPPASWPGEK